MEETKKKKENKLHISQVIFLSIVLYILWILLSGKFEAKLLIMGAIFCVFSAVICVPALTITNQRTGKEFYMLKMRPWKFVKYAIWMCGQIFMASIDVIKATLNPKRIKPCIVYFKMPFENPTASALLSNSIIITPGTITLDVLDEGIFVVHALTKNAADGLLECEMQRKVAEVFGEECKCTPYPYLTLYDIPKEVD